MLGRLVRPDLAIGYQHFSGGSHGGYLGLRLFKDEPDSIHPNPDNKTEDLIAIIASILINPNYSEYRLPNRTVRYPRTMDKETKIQKIVSRFQMGLGISEIITFTD